MAANSRYQRPHPVDAAPSTVLFDDACPLCQTLASLAARRAGPALRFDSWQSFAVSPEAQAVLADDVLARPADRLRVFTDGRLIEGDAAWAHLLTAHRDLDGLNWLAARIGMQGATIKAFAGTGALLRRLCRRCGAP